MEREEGEKRWREMRDHAPCLRTKRVIGSMKNLHET